MARSQRSKQYIRQSPPDYYQAVNTSSCHPSTNTTTQPTHIYIPGTLGRSLLNSHDGFSTTFQDALRQLFLSILVWILLVVRLGRLNTLGTGKPGPAHCLDRDHPLLPLRPLRGDDNNRRCQHVRHGASGNWHLLLCPLRNNDRLPQVSGQLRDCHDAVVTSPVGIHANEQTNKTPYAHTYTHIRA